MYDLKSSVEEFIKQNNFEDAYFEIEESYDDSNVDNEYKWLNIDIYVKRHDYLRAIELNHTFQNCSVQWWQITPELVPAKIGDFVLIFDKHESEDEKSSIGIVTEVVQGNPIRYGCSYFRSTLDHCFGTSSRIYDFELTAPNYGGYKTGFLKVLSKDEFKARLLEEINYNHSKEIKAIAARKDRCVSRLNEVVENLATVECLKIQKIQFNDMSFLLVDNKIDSLFE